jgi:hypothetical protein
MLLRGYDASSPDKPAGFDVTGLYIWGATPHIWTPQEISAYSYPLKLPISVPMWFRTGQWTPTEDAQGTLSALKALGVPFGSVVACDFETKINPGYVQSFDYYLHNAGYPVMLYGSSSTLFQNPEPSGGYWVATRPGNRDYPGDWTQYPHAGVVGTQFNDLGAYDINVFDSSLPFWGRQITPPPPNNWMDTLMQNLPTLRRGATGPLVWTLQGLLCARGHATALDGNFGPDTQAKTEAFQAAYHVPNSVVNGVGDGIWGQHTWATGITGVAQ